MTALATAAKTHDCSKHHRRNDRRRTFGCTGTRQTLYERYLALGGDRREADLCGLELIELTAKVEREEAAGTKRHGPGMIAPRRPQPSGVQR